MPLFQIDVKPGTLFERDYSLDVNLMHDEIDKVVDIAGGNKYVIALTGKTTYVCS